MKKKLIEVALPLDKINAASAKEKNIRHGHPSTLHLWWARRPLAACRAVLFASLVDDPSAHPDRFPTEEAQQMERDRLFAILEQLVQWENSNNGEVLKAAREEILKSTGGNPPPIYDPFCGGGSIPLEAQRLGLKAYASDLNPVAVLITKAMIEIPAQFANQPPVNPEARARRGLVEWRGAQGLAEDVRYYGKWMRDRAWERIGHLYPKAKLPKEMGGGEATVIAWLWARTVKCPNPACGARMPLVRSFALSMKEGKETWVEPIVERSSGEVHFSVRKGFGHPPEGTVGRRGARCLLCNEPADLEDIRAQGRMGQMSAQLMAIAAKGKNGRTYLPPDPDHVLASQSGIPEWLPDTDLPEKALGFRVQAYGMTRHCDLFTTRQLVALSAFCDLVPEAYLQAQRDGAAPDYAGAIAIYLAFAVDKCSDYWNTIATWANTGGFIRNCFARQAVPMTWDFAEGNPFSDATGSITNALEWVTKALHALPSGPSGEVAMLDARNVDIRQVIISTDPPYYDNIGYADLSDFFYVWLRRSLKPICADLFETMLVPKDRELVATPHRFGGSVQKAREAFENGFGDAFAQMRVGQAPEYPLTVFYAFKQAESEEDENGALISSTGWETMLEGLMQSGFQITGTWPLRSERIARSVALGTNALASSIVLVCRPRLQDAPVTTDMDFQQSLRTELPAALRTMQQESIAPVDLAQAAIGPGMAVYSRYSKVLGPDGKPVSVRKALEMINRVLDEVLSEQESEFDADTRFALAWFQQYGMRAGTFGVADVLSRAMNIGVSGMQNAGILESRAGTVRLLKWEELPEDWNPRTDARRTVWEVTHHLIRLMYKESESAAARVLAQVGDDAEKARDLAYRLYQICERNRWSQEAQPYNALVVAWPHLTAEARRIEKAPTPEQMTL